MIDLSMDMEQFDCPFIDTSADYEVSFSAIHWQLDTAAEQLETRLVVEAADRWELDAGLTALRDHENLNDYQLFSKHDGTAIIRTVIEETNAMSTISAHDGYITGPFHIEDGRERWQVGFDSERTADEAIVALEKGNEFVIEGRSELELDQLFDLITHSSAATTLLDAVRDLSEVEERTITAAADAGYFESPREATLSTLADEFDVSTAAVSKNMRRGEKKLLRSIVRALEDVE
ncbi:MAG: helix-turn-helix domain-containing protein [Halanaeroarchaeum sp.]